MEYIMMNRNSFKRKKERKKERKIEKVIERCF